MGFPRGRGTWLLGNTECGIFSEGVGRPQLHAENGRGIGLIQTLGGTPVGGFLVRKQACLRKQMCPVQDQAEEIMSRLAGKARDVVKVSLRSDGMLNIRQNPELIYGILYIDICIK